MSKPVKVEPEGLRRAAADFDDVADRTKRLLDTLKGSSDSKGEAWGGDHAGDKFANGEKGYKKNRDNTFTALTNLVSVFEANAKNLRDSAKVFEENEQKLQVNREQTVRARRQAVDRPGGQYDYPLYNARQGTLRRLSRTTNAVEQPADSYDYPLHSARSDVPSEQLRPTYAVERPVTSVGYTHAAMDPVQHSTFSRAAVPPQNDIAPLEPFQAEMGTLPVEPYDTGSAILDSRPTTEGRVTEPE
ncbi:uncharacterized protein YukE [Nocardia tenerifensis]|uniref:Uncharacterized protein YukE n=1 Tax=Nocardia tenerifensis TaxID=228006 RepID=A0A318JPK0_9NOCA|nr:WXG100 family type VII secretion target [Nocardia tenerifensis]PXX57608.1 uncharacterized protein YukE [Nocardia tenerifensis]